MASTDARNAASILGAQIDALSWDQALERIARWGRLRESRYVCLCNVHSVVTARNDRAFREIINAADMAAPDGMPVAWSLSRLGFPGQQRIGGPDLMWRHCERAAASGQRIFLYGGAQPTLTLLQAKLKAAFPRLRIAGAIAPPFRAPTEAEDREHVARINASNAEIVFVGLGCPKQEFWMARHRGKIRAVMIGVGAAFDYHAGTLKRAPLWMQRGGLEWAYRFAKEPRRLWRRYLRTNTVFMVGIGRQLLAAPKRRARP